MIKLLQKDTGALLGTIDAVDLQLLIDQLEEEHEKDTDYFVSAETIELLQDSGASESMLKILKAAVGSSDGVDIVWKKA